MVRIAVNGALGKMGTSIINLASAPFGYQVIAGYDNINNQRTVALGNIVISSSLSENSLLNQEKGVLIDFSSPEGTLLALAAATKAHWGLVVGTTGHDSKIQQLIHSASKNIPIVYSANMSIGVNLMAKVVELLASKLGKGFDIEITEAHHRHKKDAPSGTALLLAKAIAGGAGWDLDKALCVRQAGKTEDDRPHNQIGMQIIRAGEIVGDHTVLFAGSHETIEVKHHAESRTTFAWGALMAARFLSDKKNGLFNMMDVLGI